MAASLFAFVAAAILGRSWAEASRGFEPRSLDSESRVLTVTPRGHMLSKATPLQSIHEHVISIITHRFAIFAQPPLWDMILPSIPYSCQSRVFPRMGAFLLTWGYGATAARLTPDQKVGSSNLSALICISMHVSHSHPMSKAAQFSTAPCRVDSACEVHAKHLVTPLPSGSGRCFGRWGCF